MMPSPRTRAGLITGRNCSAADSHQATGPRGAKPVATGRGAWGRPTVDEFEGGRSTAAEAAILWVTFCCFIRHYVRMRRLVSEAARRIVRRPVTALAVAAIVALLLVYAFHLGTSAAVTTVVIPTVLALPAYLMTGPRRERETSLDEIAKKLAEAVKSQWQDEVRHWNLDGTGVLPVCWLPADPELTVEWRELKRTATEVWPGEPPPGDKVRWSMSPTGLAGGENQLADVLSRVPTQRLVVLGDPGAGKTVLLVRLLLDLFARGGPMPVLLPLASWNPDEQDLDTWVAARLSLDHGEFGKPAPAGCGDVSCARALLDRLSLLLILDGFDEIPEAVRRTALEKINRALRPRQGVVLASRTDAYRSVASPAAGSPVRLSCAAGITLENVAPLAVGDFLRRSAAGPAALRWGRVLALLGTDAPVAQALTTPLMASLARTVYDPPHGHREPLPNPAELCDPARFPTRASVEQHLFDAFIPAAYASGDGKERQCPWTAAEAERWLVFLASHFEWQGTTDLAWWQLHQAAPRSLVQFPKAVLTGLTSGLLTSLIVGLSLGVTVAAAAKGVLGPMLSIIIASLAGAAAGLAFGLLTGFAVWLVVCFLVEEDPVEIRELPSGGLRWSMRDLVIGLVGMPALFVIAILLTHSLQSDSISFLVTVCVVLAAFGAAFGARGVPSDPATAASPGAVLAQDRQTFWKFTRRLALVMGLGVGLGATTASPSDLVIVLLIGLGLGLGLGLPVGLVNGYRQTAWGAFTLTRCWLAARHLVPWRLMLFLADAHEKRGVLRQAGAVYQFRHADLQRRLAYRLTAAAPRAGLLRASMAMADEDVPAPGVAPQVTAAAAVVDRPANAVAPEDGQGVEFKESIRRKAGTIASVLGLVPLGASLTVIFVNLLPGGDLGWVFLTGAAALTSWSWIPVKIAEILLRPKLVIEREGITIRHFGGGGGGTVNTQAWDHPGLRKARLPWSELSTVEIRQRHNSQVLVCTPRPGSTLPVDQNAKRLWDDHARGFVVIDVTILRGGPSAVSVALTEYSGGRYRSAH